VQHVEVSTGDGKLSTRGDNGVREYDLLRSRAGDTLEWTQLVDADGDSLLWGKGDSGIVELRHQIESPISRPLVARVWSTLKARIYHFGKISNVLSYTERCVWRNGDTTVFSTRGIRKDSLLIPNDTSLVTYDQFSRNNGSPVSSKGRYWIRLGKLTRPFPDNAMVRFELVNRWKSGIIRYDSIGFIPDSLILSGYLGIHGTFTVLAQDSSGVNSRVAGVFRNDSIQANLHETRNGLNKNYHMVYDADGNVKTKDTLADDDTDDDYLKSKQINRK